MAAIHVMCFMYHPKVIFSIPMVTTPAAEPMMSIEPPTQAQYANNCQKIPSVAMSPVGIIGYIFIAPATRGTLSTMDDRTPMIPVTR